MFILGFLGGRCGRCVYRKAAAVQAVNPWNCTQQAGTAFVGMDWVAPSWFTGQPTHACTHNIVADRSKTCCTLRAEWQMCGQCAVPLKDPSFASQQLKWLRLKSGPRHQAMSSRLR